MKEKVKAGGPPRYCYYRGDVLWARLKVGGTEHRESLRTSDVREAAKRVRDLKVRLEREHIAGPAPEVRQGHTWVEATERWDREVLTGTLKPGAAQRYRVSIKVLAPAFSAMAVEAIGAQHVRDYVSSRVGTVTNATIRRDLSALSRLLAACCGWGWRLDNPARAYDRSLIRERREPIQPPSRRDLETFLSVCPEGMREIVRLLDATGMRLDEAVQLERWQLDPVRRQIVLTRTKTSRPRVIPWVTPAGDATAALASGEPDGFLFLGTRTGEVYRNFSSTCWTVQHLLEQRDPTWRRFRIHDLRHGWAIRALKSGMSIYQVSRHLGHSSVKTTEIYLGYLAWEEQEAVRQAQLFVFPGTQNVASSDQGFEVTSEAAKQPTERKEMAHPVAQRA